MEKPPKVYLPRHHVYAIDWTGHDGSPVALSSRLNRLSGPLERLSLIMSSVRNSLIGLPMADEESGTLNGPRASRSRTNIVYYTDDTIDSSSEDDGRGKDKKKSGFTVMTTSLRAVSSLESLSAAQQRRAALQDHWREPEETRFARLAAVLRRRRWMLLLATVMLLAFVLIIGLGLGLGLRYARANQQLLVQSGATMPVSPTPVVPSHPTVTPLTMNITASANATFAAPPVSTSSLLSSTLSANTTTVLPSTSLPPPTTTSTFHSSTSTPSPTSSTSDTPIPFSSHTHISTTPPPVETSPTPAPAPTSTPTPSPSPPPPPPPPPAPSPSPPSAPAPAPAMLGVGSGPFAGDVTFYAPGLGACGYYNSASDHIAAVSESLYDSVMRQDNLMNPNLNPICGRRIRVTASAGPAVDVTIVDRCTACAHNDVDLSPSAFDELASASAGRIKGSWVFLD